MPLQQQQQQQQQSIPVLREPVCGLGVVNSNKKVVAMVMNGDYGSSSSSSSSSSSNTLYYIVIMINQSSLSLSVVLAARDEKHLHSFVHNAYTPSGDL